MFNTPLKITSIALALVLTLSLACSRTRSHATDAGGEDGAEDQAAFPSSLGVATATGVLSSSKEESPKAAVPEIEYDFGVMGPEETGQHEFVLRNEGNAPLEVKAGGTTCKCAIANLSQRVIAPGHEGKVLIEWRTSSEQLLYLHSATVLTNDPDQPAITLSIEGRIRTELASEPASVVVAGISPGERATAEAVIYSQSWESFSIDEISSSLPGLSWDVKPAPLELLLELSANCGHQLALTIPNDLPQGFFSHWLRVRAHPDSEPEKTRTVELTITGKVLRRLSLYGKGIDSDGVIRLGKVMFGREMRVTLLMQVRDQVRQLHVTSITTTPAFVRARVTPNAASKTAVGLYNLDIEIPNDAPSCTFLGTSPGELRIVMDHPRIPELVLPLEFAVVSE